MSETPSLRLPLLAGEQAQKHLTMNEALGALDALTQLSVKSRDFAAPPGPAGEGDRYIVAAGASGAWAGHGAEVALWRAGAWTFFEPGEGWLAWVEDEDRLLVFKGVGWEAFSVAAGSELQNLALLGIGTSADAVNPFAAKLNKTLWTAKPAAEGGDGDLRYTLNKETASDVVSLLLQRGFSGRAELGLIGGDDLSLKVSADGASWKTALVVDRATGAVSIPFGILQAREKLSANRTFYVRPDGSDSNDGLTNAAGGAFATLQKAWNTIVALDLGGFAATIQIGDGTYPAGLNAAVAPLGGNVTINGNAASPGNVVVTAGTAISIGCPANVTLTNFEIRGGFYGLNVFNNASVSIGTGMRFGAATNAQILVGAGGNLTVAGDYAIVGSAQQHLILVSGGIAVMFSRTVTLIGTPAFSQAFAQAAEMGNLRSSAMTYSGAATGKRYSVETNALMNTFSGGANYFPGNAAGTTATGGLYV